MTLIVAIKATDGIVLAADSRGTIGDPRGLTAINDTQEKLHQLGRCAVALAGASEMGAMLLDQYHQRGFDRKEDFNDLVESIATVSADLWQGWFRDIIKPVERPGVILTLVGYRHTPENAVPLIYMFNSQMNFAPQLFDPAALSGIPQYAVYLFHRYFDKNINLASLSG